jgi:hypothetical protein
MCPRPFQPSCLYVVSMSFIYRRWHSGIFHCSQGYITSVKFVLGHSKFSGETSRLSLPFIDHYVPVLISRLHSTEAALQLAEDMTSVLLVCVETCIIREQSEKNFRCSEGIIYVQTVQRWGNDGALRLSCLSFSGRRQFALKWDFKSSTTKKMQLA